MSHFQWTVTSEEGVMWVVGKCWKLKPYAIIVISEENNSFQSQECGGQSILSFLNFADLALLLRSWSRQHATLYEKNFSSQPSKEVKNLPATWATHYSSSRWSLCFALHTIYVFICFAEWWLFESMARHPVVFRGRPHQSGFAKQANKHKHTNAKTNRGRPQQFGFSTRTNQVIQSHLLIKSNEMKLWTDGEHDRGDSPVHARQVRNPQRGRP